MRSQTQVIGSGFSEWLYIGVSFYSFDMRSDDLLFGDGGRLFSLDVDYSVVRSLHVIELSLGKNHLEGFWPVLLFASLPSHKSKWCI